MEAEAIEQEFLKAEEASKRTFGTVYKDLRVAHHAFRRGHIRWSRDIIGHFLTKCCCADAHPLTPTLIGISNALAQTSTPLAA